MAAGYAAAHEKDFDGLILLAAYSTKDLTGTTLRVLSVYGSEDGVMNRESYEKNRANLPADTTEVFWTAAPTLSLAAMARRMVTGSPLFRARNRFGRPQK